MSRKGSVALILTGLYGYWAGDTKSVRHCDTRSEAGCFWLADRGAAFTRTCKSLGSDVGPKLGPTSTASASSCLRDSRRPHPTRHIPPPVDPPRSQRSHRAHIPAHYRSTTSIACAKALEATSTQHIPGDGKQGTTGRQARRRTLCAVQAGSAR